MCFWVSFCFQLFILSRFSEIRRLSQFSRIDKTRVSKQNPLNNLFQNFKILCKTSVIGRWWWLKLDLVRNVFTSFDWNTTWKQHHTTVIMQRGSLVSNLFHLEPNEILLVGNVIMQRWLPSFKFISSGTSRNFASK